MDNAKKENYSDNIGLFRRANLSKFKYVENEKFCSEETKNFTFSSQEDFSSSQEDFSSIQLFCRNKQV